MLQWHPSRPGFFYFSFNNGSLNACIGKLAIKVLSKSPGNVALSPGSPPQGVPTPVPGGIVSSTPAFFRPSSSPQASGPSTGPGATAPAALHPLLPDTGGGIPFINSNPAVPLPIGEADDASVRPMPTSGHDKQVVGFLRFQISLCYVVWLLLF
ncbi:hypothetical protein GIB67_031858 [Kingdonia uniflora]|uniref:Uncharacterized protein n=1 Tax=Kingdonia uniflora TaxID=39325 RepID=A0A7J7L4S4_9MAGN|nr:hypothetical protein GIB67_031858 [Kingdonia uniflora]